MNRKTFAFWVCAFWLSAAVSSAGAVESRDDALKSLNRGTIEDSLSSRGRDGLDEGLEPEFLELDTLRAAAAEGDPEAHFRLGLAYENDRFWTPDYDKAFAHFKAAAEAGYPAAKGALGQYYQLALGTERDLKKAVWLYQDAADYGHYWSGMRLGAMYLNGLGVRKDHGRAYFWIKWASDNGVLQSTDWLGWLYENGWGVAQNYETAAKYYRQAIEDGYTDSYASLGLLYEDGLLKPGGAEKAVELYREGAERDDPRSTHFLGEMYWAGSGVAQNYAKAAELFRRSIGLGRARANISLGVAYETGKGVTEDAAAAFKHYKAMVDYDRDPQAVAYMASLMDRGLGTQKDLEKARALFIEAADKGFGYAQYEAGRMLLYGLGGEAQPQRARRYIRAAAEDGRPYAQVLLGDMYYWGNGVAEDDKEAFDWFTRAYENDPQAGGFALAQCYQYGVGVKKDVAKAREIYLEVASEDADAATGLGDIYGDKDGAFYDPERALAYYRQGHEGGDIDGTVMLGEAYFKGEGIRRNYRRAGEFFKKGAEEENALAMAYLGHMAENGLAAKKDVKAAVGWYEKAAQGNNAYAARRLVDIYANGLGDLRDRQKALHWQIKLGEGGDAKLAFEAAEALSGSALLGDKQTALDLYKVAADDGNLEATVKWGRGQILEEAAEPDFHGAVERLLTISKSDPLASLGPLSGLVRNTETGKWRKLGERNRNLFLGLAYQYGIALPADPAKAENHLRLAAQDADHLPSARYALADFLLTRVADRPGAKAEAFGHLEFAANRGLTVAQQRLGDAYLNGTGLPRDTGKAAFWLQLAGKKSVKARVAAADFVLDTKTDADEREKAVSFLEDEAETGNAEAAAALGTYHAYQADQPRFDLALHWFEKAARFGEPHALTDIGYLYKNGKLDKADAALACDYFLKAVQAGDEQAAAEAELCSGAGTRLAHGKPKRPNSH
jgi:TPR repeat protein